MREKKSDPIPLLLIVAGAVLFLPFLGRVHLFDWDEINFAECAREMVTAKQYLLVTLNYLPFWEKPPLFIWMQALSMKLFGIGDYAARLPNALCGIVTLLMLYHAGKSIVDRSFGIFWVLAYAGSILPFFYFKSGIIDPWFNLFIFSSIYFFVVYKLKQDKVMPGSALKWLLLSAAFLGFATLTKGPVAILIFSLTALVYNFVAKGKRQYNFGHIGIFFVVLTLTGCSWFITEIATGHENIIIEFIQYQIRLFKTDDAGHGGPFYYHFIVLLFGCFPASVLAIQGMVIKKGSDGKLIETSRWMAMLFWVVIILFSIVKTKIIHYSSLCYYPLSFFAAFALYQIKLKQSDWKKWLTAAIMSIGILIGSAMVLMPVAGMNTAWIIKSGILKDPFAADNLLADVHWSYTYCLIGLFFTAGIIIAPLLFRRGLFSAGIITLFGTTIISTYAMLFFFVPKIEQYTQQAAVEFYEGLQGKNVYVATLGYKSYAQYYYARTQSGQNVSDSLTGRLLDGKTDKQAYFSCKVDVAADYKKDHPLIKELYRKNGFVFFLREPDAN